MLGIMWFLKLTTTQASAADRAKIYVNGSEVSDWAKLLQAKSQTGDSFLNCARDEVICNWNLQQVIIHIFGMV